MQSENEYQIELMNDFKAHELRWVGLLELATDKHGIQSRKRSEGQRLPLPVIPANAGIQRYKLQSMDPRLREDDELTPRASEAKGPLPAEEGWVMEKKKKKEKETHPAQWVGLCVFCLWVGLLIKCSFNYLRVWGCEE